MAGVLEGVDKRTQLVGENRLELLLFRLSGPQLYGINVFKVQEVIRCPALTHLPNANRVVKGVASMRGRTIPVIDLGMAMGRAPMADIKQAFVVIADYNRTVQGFLVQGVERIVNMNWKEIMAPPKGSGANTYMTAVTRVDNRLVEIIDVEKVLAEVVGSIETVASSIVEGSLQQEETTVMVVDDSSVARKQILRTLEQLGYKSVVARDGKEALDMLQGWAKEGDIRRKITLLISDVEMPNMDGYTLTTEIRKDANLANLYIILHTSLSGVFNQSMVQKVGANCFIPKFNANDLAQTIVDSIAKIKSNSAAA